MLSFKFFALLSPLGELLFFASPKKRSQKKGDPWLCVSCALQKFAVAPVRHPCRIVTQTHFLCVCRQFSSSARQSQKGVNVKSKSKNYFKPKIRRFAAWSVPPLAKSSNARSVTLIMCCAINGAPSAAPTSGCFKQHSHSNTAQPS